MSQKLVFTDAWAVFFVLFLNQAVGNSMTFPISGIIL